MKFLTYVNVEPEVDVSYEVPEIRKIIYGRRFLGAIKILKAAGGAQVNAYNFANYLHPYTFSTSEQTRLEHPLGATRIFEQPDSYFLYIKALFGIDSNLPPWREYPLWGYPRSTPLQRVMWSHPEEEDGGRFTGVEQPDKFFWIPPVETGEHRSVRLQDELTYVARLGIEKLLLLNDIPDLLAGHSSYTGAARSAYSNFLRNAITSFKVGIGYLQSQLNAAPLDD